MTKTFWMCAAGMAVLTTAACTQAPVVRPLPQPAYVADPAAYVNPLIGTANGGNTFPGAVVPFGMLAWSPENTKGKHAHTAAPGGYQYDATRIRGFSLTHLSGTGCAGASGDIPFMPYVGKVASSPSSDVDDSVYASTFSHTNETAEAGYYKVKLDNGVTAELTATTRTGAARFTFPQGKPATLLIRASDSEVGSSAAHVVVHPETRIVTGSVTSGNFCGYIDPVDRHSYYTLYFVAKFDRPFARVGTWHDGEIQRGGTSVSGGTTYALKGYPVPGRGSGAWVGFDTGNDPTVNVRVGISYVSLANAEANLRAENPPGTTFAVVRQHAHSAWSQALSRIEIAGGTRDQLTTFYTALYHALLHPNIFSDVNGQYRGFDQETYTISGDQHAQYANFSGWDVYRSQLQLVTLLYPDIGSDIAQSLLNQARQNHGDWDRWTHNAGATHVMEGDPSPAAIAGIYAFGGTRFDANAALQSLVQAATVPTADDLSHVGCPVECAGERPSLDDWLKIHYIPTKSNAWGGAGETLEDASADFAVAQLARRLGDQQTYANFLKRAQYWRNVYNPHATIDQGYIQNRNADGSWPKLDPTSSDGFAEGSSAQYTWMVPFNVAGLFDAMGGMTAANRRLDAFFHNADGGWALTKAGGLHAEMDNEPSVETRWLYDFSGKPYKTQQTVRQIINSLWRNAPDGIPGNDDLGEMSSWYVWAALGLYPIFPGRSELVLASPLFPHALIRRGNGAAINIDVLGAATDAPYVRSLKLNGEKYDRAWLPEWFVVAGGRLEFVLRAKPNVNWASAPADAPPSFGAAP